MAVPVEVALHVLAGTVLLEKVLQLQATFHCTKCHTCNPCSLVTFACYACTIYMYILSLSVCRPSRGGAHSDEAQQRFSSAKSISSDQYFGRSSGDSLVSVLIIHTIGLNLQNMFWYCHVWCTLPHATFYMQEGGSNMSRFVGSSSISSDDYFGRTPKKCQYTLRISSYMYDI